MAEKPFPLLPVKSRENLAGDLYHLSRSAIGEAIADAVGDLPEDLKALSEIKIHFWFDYCSNFGTIEQIRKKVVITDADVRGLMRHYEHTEGKMRGDCVPDPEEATEIRFHEMSYDEVIRYFTRSGDLIDFTNQIKEMKLVIPGMNHDEGHSWICHGSFLIVFDFYGEFKLSLFVKVGMAFPPISNTSTLQSQIASGTTHQVMRDGSWASGTMDVFKTPFVSALNSIRRAMWEKKRWDEAEEKRRRDEERKLWVANLAPGVSSLNNYADQVNKYRPGEEK